MQPQSSSAVLSPQLLAWIQTRVENAGSPGVSLVVVHPTAENGPEYANWGFRTEEGDPMFADTLSLLASTSKSFVAAAIGILIDDFSCGRNIIELPNGLRSFTWDTKLRDIFEGFQLLDDTASQLTTVRDAMSHLTGLPDHGLCFEPNDSPMTIIQRMRHLRPVHEFRRAWNYNSLMYILGTEIVTTLSGCSYVDFVTDRIFRPLGMSSTTFHPDFAAASGRLAHMFTAGGRRIPFWISENEVAINAGTGGVISSTEDLGKYLRMWMNHGVDPTSGTTIIRSDQFREITSAQGIVVGQPPSGDISIVNYCMGWGRMTRKGHNILYHAGNAPGTTTSLTWAPGPRGLGIAILINREWMNPLREEIRNRILDEAFGTLDSGISPVQSSPPPIPAKEGSGDNESRLPMELYAGTYTNAGYGTLTLYSPGDLSAEAQGVLKEYSAVGIDTSPDSPILVARWPRNFFTHLSLTHERGHTFAPRAQRLFPAGYGANKTPFETGTRGAPNSRFEFAVEANGSVKRVIGFGILGSCGPPTPRELEGGDIEQRADTWFVRVQAAD